MKCPQCQRVRPPTVVICECGHQFAEEESPPIRASESLSLIGGLIEVVICVIPLAGLIIGTKRIVYGEAGGISLLTVSLLWHALLIGAALSR